jgi:GTPase SAR1 family protein
LANELGIPFMEVSAKANINVEEAFLLLARDIKKRIMDSSVMEKERVGTVNVNETGNGTGGKCC